ncbi:YadA-like family protein [Klebsiella oxytoca]|uniref:YadA-like family protein n=1 Tax=Klebsiella oxytoca TaxID=571 RepID=UPI00190EDD9E|nr:YadA-like family protein [Klebsiella oxytoca]
MNRIYNLKWDPIKGMLVPVSELANLRTSGGLSAISSVRTPVPTFSGNIKLLSLLITGVILSLNSEYASAYVVGGGIATDDGYGRAVAIGTDALATGQTGGYYVYSVAVGSKSKATATSTVAIGDTAEALGVNATAVGAGSQAAVARATSLGSWTKALATDSLALGAYAAAEHENSVALGAKSTSSDTVSTATGTLNNKSYTFAGGKANGNVSIGSGSTITRTLTSLAAGRISNSSTDAVNGSQLFATNSAIEDLAQGWIISDAGGSKKAIKTGDTVTMAASNANLSVTQNDGRLTMGLANNLDLGATGSVNIGGTHIGANGLELLGGPGVTIDGMNAGGKVITNVKEGVASSDAVNVGQLKNLDVSLTTKGLDVAGNSGLSHLNLGDKISIVGEGTTKGAFSSKNVRTSLDGQGQLVIAMAESPAFGSVVINPDGSGRISGVAAGVSGTDAVNVSQLNSVNDALTNKGLNLAGNSGSGHLNLGDTLTIKGEGTTTGSYSGANLKTSADAKGNLNITMVDAPKFGNLIVNENGSGRIGGVSDGISPNDAVNKGQLDNVKEVANQGWNVSDGQGSSSKVNPGGTVTFKSNNSNMSVVQANGVVTMSLSNNINLGPSGAIVAGNTSLNNGGLTILGGPSVTSGGGINAGGKVISDVAAGVKDSDAVNVGQLNDVKLSAGGGWIVSDAEGYTKRIGAGDKVIFAPGNDNLTVAQKDGTVTVGLANDLDLGAVGTIKSGDIVLSNSGLRITDGPSVTVGGISAGNKVIKDVAAGKAETDAVNVGQLTGLDKSLTEKGLGLAGNSGTGHLSLGDTLAVRGEGTTAGTYSGANLRTSVGEDGSLNIAMAASPKFGSVTVNVDDSGRISGVADGVDGNDAVNKGQLDSVGAVAGRGWNVKAAGQTAEEAHNVKPGDTVSFAASNGNLTVAQKDGTVTVGLSDALTLGADGSIAMGGTTVNSDGLTIASGPSVTAGGISAGNKVIKDVAAGKAETDAVNVGQLTGLDKSLTEKGLGLAGNSGTGHLSLGDTLAVRGEGTTAGTYSGANLRTSVGEDGSLNIAMAASPKFGSVTVNVDDSGRISGVADGVDGNDAVNKGQLDNVIEVANTGWNVSDAKGNSKKVAPGDTVTFAPSNDNLSVNQLDGIITIGLAKDLNLTDSGSVTIGNVRLNNGGLKIVNGPSITTDGIDAGGKRITNVADAIEDKDAVNYGQLKNWSGDIVNNINNNGIRYFHANSKGKDSIATGNDAIAIGPGSVASGNNAVATGNGAIASGTGTIASGNDAKASGENTIALGTNSNAIGRGSIAMGNNSSSKAEGSVSIGMESSVTENASNSIALGSYSVADRENTLSVGSKGNERQITNVADGKELTDAVNVGQLKGIESSINNIGGNVTNITEGREGMFQVNNTSKRAKPAPIGEDALAGGAGAKASGKNSVAVGNNSLASAENSVALGNNSSAKSSNSVALGTASVADRDNTISVGASGSERQITNVARGTRGTDAVNLDQLTQATDASNQYTDNKFSQLKQMVDKNKDKLSAGIAGAMAMATLPQPYSPGASMMALSGGTYQGQSAIALGVSTISDNGKWVSKLSGMSNSQGDFGVSVGVGYQW